MLKVGVPMKVDMHQASAAIILKFNRRRRLCLVFIIIFLLNYEQSNLLYITFNEALIKKITCRSLLLSSYKYPCIVKGLSVTEQIYGQSFRAAKEYVQLLDLTIFIFVYKHK